MKLLRHGQPGCERPGALDETGRIRDLSSIVSDIDRTLLSRDCADLKGVDLAGFPEVEPETRLGSPVSGVGKFICIGLNSADHAREADRASDPRVCERSRRLASRGRAVRDQRHLRTGIPARARRPMGQGKRLRHVWPGWTILGDTGRNPLAG